ncbi:hypothetical protein NO263_02530 [Gluconacetobacter entanii]|uniref:MobA/VirD2-like nuclease domain-containing protein n=1 Tax=Gluconacetobacter entanii TaxID=108528 RepID=A0ABT3K227_9PROT|nr:hypothetical protein [Gluconacetobacter entanii]MCW4589458.1 hypothetical protein [Gluconacetobacter entanii]MCW4593158.1 hypothetical protein [Gluconacetobacter entanii]NPC90303.1 hypothetical protein [Gluconacetobacter entanii]
MIIKGGPVISKNGHQETATHIFEGPKNERITPIQGNALDMANMVTDARDTGLKYGFHHFKISPEREISREQARQDFQAIAYEYGFDLSDAVIVEHQKQRTKKENSAIHWHMIVPHYNQKTGRALDCRNSYKRNEKLSRLSEIRTGQNITQGRHNRAVFHALQQEGKTVEANTIQHLTEGELPGASFSTNLQRKAERKGISLPEEKSIITDIWSQSDSLKAFISGLGHNGFTFKKGDKKDTYIIEKEGTLIGSVNRLLKIKKGEFAKLYNQYQEDLKNEHLEMDEERQRHRNNGQEGRNAQDAHTGQKEGRGGEAPTQTKKQHTGPREETRTTETPTATRGKPDIDEGEKRHIPDIGPFGATREHGRNRPNPANPRVTEHDNGAEPTDNNKPESHIASVRAQARIRRGFNVKKHKDNRHLSVITPEYMENIKQKIKEDKNGNREFFRQQYKNIREQEYHINKHNNTIDTSCSLLLVEMFLRLFGYTMKKEKPTPTIIKPDVFPPITSEEFSLMNDREKQQIIWKSYGLYKSAHSRYASICEKHNVPFDDFQTWLNDLGGDFMSEEIANLYPDIYMKNLEKSENEDDKETLKLLRETWNGTGKYADQFTPDDLKTDIETIKNFISDDIKIKKITEEWYKNYPPISEKTGETNNIMRTETK